TSRAPSPSGCSARTCGASARSSRNSSRSSSNSPSPLRSPEATLLKPRHARLSQRLGETLPIGIERLELGIGSGKLDCVLRAVGDRPLDQASGPLAAALLQC